MKYIALLRGINVSGHKKIPMAELRALLTDSGLENVQTYIQTGNVIFDAAASPEILKNQIEVAIKNHFGFDVSVLVITPKVLRQIFDDCPFSEEKKQSSYFSLLYDAPKQELIDAVAEIKYPNEEVSIAKNCIYFYCSTGYGKTKYNNNFFEKKLNVTATARNYKTMLKLLSLSE